MLEVHSCYVGIVTDMRGSIASMEGTPGHLVEWNGKRVAIIVGMFGSDQSRALSTHSTHVAGIYCASFADNTKFIGTWVDVLVECEKHGKKQEAEKADATSRVKYDAIATLRKRLPPGPLTDALLLNRPGGAVVAFGKHRGKTLASLAKLDASWCKWACGTFPAAAPMIQAALEAQSNGN